MKLTIADKLYRACHSINTDSSPSSTSQITKFTSCLPRSLANKIEQKVQHEQDHQREWVIGVLICACVASVILFLNIALTIIAAILSYSKFRGHGFTSAVLYQGSCSLSKNWVRGLHVLINILSTVVLAASNYCMQCLSSPSRENVVVAHSQWRWLDIGVSSMENLRFVGWKRCMLWVLLLISSLPIHLMFVWNMSFLRFNSDLET